MKASVLLNAILAMKEAEDWNYGTPAELGRIHAQLWAARGALQNELNKLEIEVEAK